MALTLRGDLYNPELASAYTGFAFVENLGMLSKFVGPTTEKPFCLRNTGILRAMGNFVDNPKFNPIASIVTRVDNTSTGAASILGLTTRNDISVRISRKIGPVMIAKNAINQAGYTADMLAMEIGNQGGKFWALELRNILISLAKAACDAITSTLHTTSVYVASGTKAKLNTDLLLQARDTMGDSVDFDSPNAGLVMRSASLTDLARYQGGQGVQGISERIAESGAPLTTGLQYAVANAAALKVTNGGSYKKYYVLGIAPGLIEVEIESLKWDEPWYQGNLENNGWIFRADVEAIITMRGFKWDTSGGGVNPTDSALATAGNWIVTYSDDREVPAFEIECNANPD